MKHPLDLFQYCPECGSSHFEVNNEKSKKCTDCGFVYYFNPSSATVALILNDQNELLVCRRAKEPAKGTLDLPGGFIDMNETGEEGVAREVLEALLDKYAENGILDFEKANILEIPPFNSIGKPTKIIKLFGGKVAFEQAIRELEYQIYKSA